MADGEGSGRRGLKSKFQGKKFTNLDENKEVVPVVV